ncbi:MAG: 3-hydroxyacyl-CoA dehydrogenase NAD-binding domain-containing protein, partial [Alphaproteobacteria bacterium]
MTVRVEIRGGIAVVTLDSPPVNAIGRAEREGLLVAVRRVADDPVVVAAVLTGAGRAFAAGANAAEFDLPPQPPHLPEVVDAIEASEKPWVAAIDGPALGGGYELALACRRRVAGPRALVGLPEVTLGVVPGAGGTQRLPRLIGFAPALELIAAGRTVKAAEATQLGMVDALADDPLAAAIDAAHALAGSPPAPLSARSRPIADAGTLAAARAAAARRMRGQDAPQAAIRLVETAAATDFAEGVRIERAAFLQLRESPQAKALRHIFFAERAARKRPELQAAAPGEIASAVVVGGGTMGAGIAYALNAAGIAVSVVETDAPALDRARSNVGRLFATAVQRGLMTEPEAAERQGRLGWATSLDGLGEADLAVEAVFEDLAVKQDLFRRLDAAMRPGALLATNTSYLDVNLIAAATARPEAVLGLHFFSPAHIMKLLEVVRADRTSAEALATALALAARLGKVPVVAGVCDGFIGNRILARYREVADMILIDGALPWEIDAAMVDFGFAMGLYATQDLSGLDIAYANRKRLAATRDPRRRYVAIADRVVEAGRLG